MGKKPATLTFPARSPRCKSTRARRAARPHGTRRSSIRPRTARRPRTSKPPTVFPPSRPPPPPHPAAPGWDVMPEGRAGERAGRVRPRRVEMRTVPRRPAAADRRYRRRHPRTCASSSSWQRWLRRGTVRSGRGLRPWQAGWPESRRSGGSKRTPEPPPGLPASGATGAARLLRRPPLFAAACLLTPAWGARCIHRLRRRLNSVTAPQRRGNRLRTAVGVPGRFGGAAKLYLH